MRVSTRARYGLRLMYQLALHYEKEPVILKEIAKAEDISEKYLSHLIIPLKGVGLIQGSRGAHGGYMLAKKPEQTTVREIVEILEGDLNIVPCTKNPLVCKRASGCVSRDVWSMLRDKISDVLDSITLADVVKMSGREKGHFYSI